jgi:hypothetical protein
MSSSALGFRDRLGGGHHQLQREQHEPQADGHAPDLADLAVAAREEEHHAEEDEQRREPGEVEREELRDERGAHVGAEHDRERHRQPDQVLRDERARDERRGARRLYDAGHAEPREKRREAVGDTLRQDPAKVRAEDAQHPGAHDVRAPHEEGHAGHEV